MACCTCLNILYVIVNTRKNTQLFIIASSLLHLLHFFGFRKMPKGIFLRETATLQILFEASEASF